MNHFVKNCLVKPGKKLKLEKRDPGDTAGVESEEQGIQLMNDDIAELTALQEKIFATDRHSVLIILQGMDASGKDGLIKHVISAFNMQGCKITSFKRPGEEEYKHDFLWNFNKLIPGRGQVGVFNRSYYEYVLICKVHPEYILKEQLPGYDSLKKLDEDFWEHRYRQINRFEKTMAQNGTLVLKFFLHISKKEQAKRLLERIDNPEKNWKFNINDINERAHWDTYQHCYKKMLEATSTEEAPWYVIPADHKWYARAAVAGIMKDKLSGLRLKHHPLSEEEKAQLSDARSILLSDPKITK